ncbi:MAG TPA: hypothetical protein VN739_01905 [Nitrososphaerales archaeon]|nr:hypothetical protein [Nitrososphaerales archaeon]
MADSSVQTIRVSKTINAPMKYVFNWCTDFREDDPGLTGSKSQRKILEKTKKRVVYASLYTGEDGSPKIGVNIVTLKSPVSWHLEYFGEDDDEIGEYKLVSLGKNKTKLNMVFKEKWKTVTIPTIEEQVESTDKVWDQYVSALEKEYNS